MANLFCIFVESGSHCVAQAGLRLPASSNLHASASQRKADCYMRHLFGSAWSSERSDSLALLARLECRAATIARCILNLQVSSNPPASASQVAGTTGVYYHTWLTFYFFVETGSHYVAQAGLEFLGLRDPPASASQSTGITDEDTESQKAQVDCLAANRSNKYIGVYQPVYIYLSIKIFIWVRCSSSCMEFQLLRRLRQEDHLRPGV
ncbi:hypothetical protein AAY473_025821 [Plecturocebus cupreus]